MLIDLLYSYCFMNEFEFLMIKICVMQGIYYTIPPGKASSQLILMFIKVHKYNMWHHVLFQSFSDHVVDEYTDIFWVMIETMPCYYEV